MSVCIPGFTNLNVVPEATLRVTIWGALFSGFRLFVWQSVEYSVECSVPKLADILRLQDYFFDCSQIERKDERLSYISVFRRMEVLKLYVRDTRNKCYLLSSEREKSRNLINR